MDKKKLILFYWMPVVLYAVLISYFSSLSDPYSAFPDGVKAVISLSSAVWHILEYAVFYLLFYRALVNSGFAGWRRHIFSLLGTLGYAVIDEMHQLFVVGRHFSFGDIFFDLIGGIFGWAVIVIFNWFNS
jgi:VanZ family protein